MPGGLPRRITRSFTSVVAQRAGFGDLPAPENRRVVVTGIGLVTPLAVGASASWSELLTGRSAVRALTEADIVGPSNRETFEQLRCKVAATVDHAALASSPWLAACTARLSRWPPFIRFALAASFEAIFDAGCPGSPAPSRESAAEQVAAAMRALSVPSSRFGASIGAGMGSSADIAEVGRLVATGSVRRLSPYFVPGVLVNMPSGLVSLELGLRGPNLAAATACAAGAHAIAAAFDAIRLGQADAMICGGAESAIDIPALAGFGSLRALAGKYNNSPGEASRPFDVARDGFVMGEGAGVLVLEEAGRAAARGARVYAELRGAGCSGDAHHITLPPEDGDGAVRCMEAAMRAAGVRRGEVAYINAHATSTPDGDEREQVAIERVFQARATQGVTGDAGVAGPASHTAATESAPGSGALNEMVGSSAGGEGGAHSNIDGPPLPLWVSSTKGATGHLLGAAGGVEAAFTALALHHRIAPPTANLQRPDPPILASCLVRQKPQPLPSQIPLAALSNSFGFGGTNATLVFATAPHVL